MNPQRIRQADYRAAANVLQREINQAREDYENALRLHAQAELDLDAAKKLIDKASLKINDLITRFDQLKEAETETEPNERNRDGQVQ